MVYGAGCRDGQSISVQDRHVSRPHVVTGGLGVVVVRVVMGAVGRDHVSDVINEGGIN